MRRKMHNVTTLQLSQPSYITNDKYQAGHTLLVAEVPCLTENQGCASMPSLPAGRSFGQGFYPLDVWNCCLARVFSTMRVLL